MIVLSKEQILFMHQQLIDETGGLDGVRDESLLDSAINAPFQKFDGKDLFPTVQQKAARLCFGIIKNHAFCRIKMLNETYNILKCYLIVDFESRLLTPFVVYFI